MFPSKASFRVHKVRAFFQLLAKLLLLKAHCCSFTNFHLISHTKSSDISSSNLTRREAGSVFLTSPPSPHAPASWYRAEAGIKSRKILIPCPWCWQTPLPFYNSADSLMGCIHLSLLSSLWQSISKDLTSPHTYLNFLLLVSCRKWSHRHQQNSSGLKPYSFLSTQGLYRLCTQLLQLAFQLHLFSALQDQAFGWSSGSKYSSKWLMRAH